MVIELISTEVPSRQYQAYLKHPERFSVVDVLGYGAFGEVVLAKDTSNSNKDVAIKKLDVDDQVRHVKDILREVVVLHWAKHPQIVELITVYMEHYERVPTTVYIVMGYCGRNLVEYINMRNEAVTLDETANILYNIARGLNFLHAFGIYHRDLKPSNICIDANDLQFRAKIIDLGYARKKPHDSNELTRGIATMCYRAPENLIGLKYSEKIDVWSLGCIFGFVIKAEHIFHDDKSAGTTRAFLNTLELICGYLGKPPQSFMNMVKTFEEESSDKMDYFTWDPFKRLVERFGAQDLEPLFSDLQADPKKGDGIKLMEGMLKWDHGKRITIKDILESKFVAEIRDRDSERLPEGELREYIKSSLDKHENEIKDILEDSNNALVDMKNYLFDVIAEEFGHDKDLDDYYSYASCNSS